MGQAPIIRPCGGYAAKESAPRVSPCGGEPCRIVHLRWSGVRRCPRHPATAPVPFPLLPRPGPGMRGIAAAGGRCGSALGHPPGPGAPRGPPRPGAML